MRSRFSHRKLLFLPPSGEELQRWIVSLLQQVHFLTLIIHYNDLCYWPRLVEHILLLPEDSRLPNDYTAAFNSELVVSFSWKHCNSCCKSSQKWNEPSNSEDICISNVISFILVEFHCFCFYTMSIRMSHSLPPINRQQVCIVSFFFELFGSSFWLNWHGIFLFNKQHIMFVRMSCFCFSEDYLLELWYLVYHTFQFQTNFLSHETVP